MTYFEAYILTRLDPLKSLFLSLSNKGIGVLIILFAILFTSFLLIESPRDLEYDQQKTIKKIKNIFFFLIIPVYCLSFIIATLIPTSKEMAFIYIAPAIVNNKDVQKTIQKIPELSGLGLEYLTETLKSEIKEVKGELKEVVKDTAKEVKTITEKEAN